MMYHMWTVALLGFLAGDSVTICTGDKIALFSVADRIATSVYEIWEDISKQTDNRTEMDILSSVADLGRQMERLEIRLRDNSIVSLLHDLPSRLRQGTRMDTLADLIGRVSIAERQLHRYATFNKNRTSEEGRMERESLVDFAVGVVSTHPSSVRTLIERLHEMVIPRTSGVHKGVLDLVLEVTQDHSITTCHLHQSPQQLIYSIYSAVALGELKGYVIMHFSWMLLNIYGKGTFSSEAHIMRERYEEWTKQKIPVVKAAMVSAKRDAYRCDPNAHTEGETYVQLTRLLQGHIENEVDLNEYASCWQTCKDYNLAKSHSCYYGLQCAKQQRCKGKLRNCAQYERLEICPADEKSTRRYNWISECRTLHKDLGIFECKTLGKMDECHTEVTNANGWRRGFYDCDYCLCLCDEDEGFKSDRYFNLREVRANVDANMVVTDVRMVKNEGIIHMQIQEAALLPYGGLDVTTLRWRPVDNYWVNGSGVVIGEDVHKLSWEHRRLDLDDLLGAPGYVLTGFRFRRMDTHLRPEIMVTPLDFTEGQLIRPRQTSKWVSYGNSAVVHREPYTELRLQDPDVPTLSTAPSFPDSQPGQYMHFTHTDLHKDGAQTTVPFLDAQPIQLNPPTLLAGVGLYHKGQRGYGGYIAPKLFTYDYSEHM